MASIGSEFAAPAIGSLLIVPFNRRLRFDVMRAQVKESWN